MFFHDSLQVSAFFLISLPEVQLRDIFYVISLAAIAIYNAIKWLEKARQEQNDVVKLKVDSDVQEKAIASLTAKAESLKTELEFKAKILASDYEAKNRILESQLADMSRQLHKSIDEHHIIRRDMAAYFAQNDVKRAVAEFESDLMLKLDRTYVRIDVLRESERRAEDTHKRIERELEDLEERIK